MASAVSTLKLTVDDREYGASIKEAKRGMLDLEESLKLAGKSFKDCEAKVSEYVRNIGNMETSNKTAKGSISEMSSAFVELSKQYRSMSDEMKKSDVGKSLSASLDTLKTRIIDGKKELESIGRELGETGTKSNDLSGALDALAAKFGLNIGQLTKFGGVLAALTAALKVAKDAFFQSESNIDEWGRTVKGAEGAYTMFLDTLNGGNWQNFFDNLSKAIQGGRDLYDAFDRLSSIKANNQLAIAMVQAQIQQLRVLKQQGANVDGQIKEASERLRQLQMQGVDAGKQAGARQLATTLTNRVRGISGSEVVTGADIGHAVAQYARQGQAYVDQQRAVYQQLAAKGAYQYQSSIVAPSGGTMQVTKNGFDMSKLTREEQKQYVIAQAVTDGETELQKGIATMTQAVQEQAGVWQQQFRNNRYELQGSRGGSGTDPVKQAREKVAAAQHEYAQSIEQAKMSLDNGTATEAEYKKKQLAAEERLWNALGDAYQIHKDPKYKEAQDKCAAEIQRLGGEVKSSVEAQEASGKAARELEAAQKKLNDALTESANAYTSNNLKGYIAAQKKIGGDVNAGIANGNFTYTSGNLDAFISNLKEQISHADIGSELHNKLTAQLADATTLGTLMQTAIQNGIDTAQFNPQDLWKKVFGDNPGDYIDDPTWQSIVDQINEKISEINENIPPISINFKTGRLKEVTTDTKAMSKEWQYAAKAINQVGNAMNQIDDPAAKVMATIAQAVASVMLGYAEATTQAASMGPWAWIAFAAAGLATAITTVSQIKAATKGGFAEGGIVPGNSYSGDLLHTSDYGINSGELILNRAQQNSIASQLENPGGGGVSSMPYVTGETILLGLNNHLQRDGQGEIVTTSMLKHYGLV